MRRAPSRGPAGRSALDAAAVGEVDAVYDLHVPPPLAERMMKG
jgi:hypothetical protein